MAEWLRCSTHIHKITRSKCSIIILEVTLDKSLLTVKLFRMTNSYRANASSVRMLDGRDANTAVCEKKKMIGTDCM